MSLELWHVTLLHQAPICGKSSDRFERGKDGFKLAALEHGVLFERPGHKSEVVYNAAIFKTISMAAYEQHLAEQVEAEKKRKEEAELRQLAADVARLEAGEKRAADGPHTPPAVSVKEMSRDLAADGDMSEEEERSMKAALARGKKK